MLGFRKYLFVVLLFAVVASAYAVELENVEQRYTYTAVYSFVQQLRSQAIEADKEALLAAVEDAFAGKEPRMSREEMEATVAEVKEIVTKLIEERLQKKAEEEEKFLSENKSKEGVIELESGLQYIPLKDGKGDSPVMGSSTVTIHYRGTLKDGEEFDSSYARNQPAEFELDSGLIQGFGEALTMMKPGAKWKLFVPSRLGYGARGKPPKIGPNEPLVFEIELISFENTTDEPEQEEKSDGK